MNAEELDRFELIGKDLEDLVHIVWQKRVLDVVLSSILIVAFSPIIVLILLVITAEGLITPRHRGPLFLTEERGSEGETFHLPKFRIIRMDAFREIRKTQKF